ncbi:hypothetical protein [Chamaesiphon sp. GL140_3_metabinner_50]|uniref:hypothetical protein n=1 Tax=Chamaesiphon sp. GL140_3_metabinner_50 TaxID=2970812 RepID=UPI0025DC184A|nr:hypothetical protein [Chamaesiphon sp. GL140_3_metabinner_50]
MMKFTKFLCQIISIATIGMATAAIANPISISGAYKGDGYILDLSSGGEYHSCDPRNRCVTIPRTQSTQQGQTYIWKRNGYSYQVTPVGNRLKAGHYTRISVRVIDTKQRVIFDRIMRYQ